MKAEKLVEGACENIRDNSRKASQHFVKEVEKLEDKLKILLEDKIKALSGSTAKNDVQKKLNQKLVQDFQVGLSIFIVFIIYNPYLGRSSYSPTLTLPFTSHPPTASSNQPTTATFSHACKFLPEIPSTIPSQDHTRGTLPPAPCGSRKY